MTAAKVVDASAVVAVLFDEPRGDEVAQRLAGAPLAAPSLLSFELANVCAMKGRRHPEDRDALLQALRLRGRLGVEEVPVDAGEVAELALETGLTAYDASYLWLARQLGAELVTLDKALAAAAPKPA